MSEELSLFRNMQQGDVSALEYFFQEYADLLYYRALGYVHHSQVAEDVVQEVFIGFGTIGRSWIFLFLLPPILPVRW